MVVKFMFQSGPRSGEDVAVDQIPFVIGRAATCNLRVDQDLVAEEHCRIMIHGARVTVEDLDSLHGTVVNNRLITTGELHDGDKLRIGPARFLVAIISGSSRVESRPQAPVATRGEPPPMPVGTIGMMDSVPDSPATQLARALLDQMTHKKVHAKEFVYLRLGESDGITLVELVGKGKAFTEDHDIARLEQELTTLIVDGHNRVVLNFKNIERIAGAAITAVLGAHRLCTSRGGMLKVCKLRPMVDEMFRATTASRRIQMFADEWAATGSDWPEVSALELDAAALASEENSAPKPLQTVKPRPAPAAVEAPAPKPQAVKPVSAPASQPAPRHVPVVGATGPAGRPANAPIVRLSVLVGKSKGQVLEIQAPRFVIGRDPKCQLRPNSESVSRLHTRIDQRDGRVFVRDLGAANGTLVNDQQLHAQEIEVFDGDRLEVGPLVFAFSINNRVLSHAPQVEDMVATWVLEEGTATSSDQTAYFIPVYKPETGAGEPRPDLIKPPKTGGQQPQ